MAPKRLVQVDIMSREARRHGEPYTVAYIPNPRTDFNVGGRYIAAPNIGRFEDLVIEGRKTFVCGVRPIFISTLAYSLAHENDVAVTAFHYRNLRDAFGKRAYSHWKGLKDRFRRRFSILKLSGQSYPPSNGSDATTTIFHYETGHSWKTGAGVPLRPGTADPRVVYIEYLEPAQPQQPIDPDEWEMVPVTGKMVEFRRRKRA